MQSAHGSVTTCTYRSPTLSESVLIEYDTAASAASFAADRSELEQHGEGAHGVDRRPRQRTQAYSFALASSGSPVNYRGHPPGQQCRRS